MAEVATSTSTPPPPPPVQHAPPPKTPSGAQTRAVNELARLLQRSNPDFNAAQLNLTRALQPNALCIESVRVALKRPNLSAQNRVTLLSSAVQLSEASLRQLLGENCFSSQASPQIYGHFWRIPETQGYVRLQLDLVSAASDAQSWQLALDAARRVLEVNHGDNSGIRDRVPLFLLHLGRPLDALNFCLCWLDTSHEGYDSTRYCPVGGFADLRRYKKEDFEPSKSQQLQKVQNLGHASLIFSAALAAQRVFGTCPLAVSWLREAHNANPHVIPILLQPVSEWPDKTNSNPRGIGSEPEARDYVFFSRSLWEGKGVEWVKEVQEEVQRKECARRECRKVEAHKGEYKVCAGCRASWYCGKECQEKDWKTGGHKRRCKEERNIRDLTEKMGKGMQWGK